MTDRDVIQRTTELSAVYDIKNVTLASGESQQFLGEFRYVSLLTASDTANVSISFNGSYFVPLTNGFVIDGFVTRELWIKNTSGLVNSIQITVGSGAVHDTRLTFNALAPLPVTISAGSVGLTNATLSDNADALAAAANRDLPVVGFNFVWNGATWDRLPGNTKRIKSSMGLVTTVSIATATTQATGANWTTLGAGTCDMVDLMNDTGATIEYRRGGAGSTFHVLSGDSRMIAGLTNANQIDIRRVDNSNTQVTVQLELITV